MTFLLLPRRLALSDYISAANSSLGSRNGGPGQRSLPVWCSMTPWKVAVSVRHPTPSLIIPLLDHLTHDTSPSALPSEKEGERLGFAPREKHTKDPEKAHHMKVTGIVSQVATTTHPLHK